MKGCPTGGVHISTKTSLSLSKSKRDAEIRAICQDGIGIGSSTEHQAGCGIWKALRQRLSSTSTYNPQVKRAKVLIKKLEADMEAQNKRIDEKLHAADTRWITCPVEDNITIVEPTESTAGCLPMAYRNAITCAMPIDYATMLSGIGLLYKCLYITQGAQHAAMSEQYLVQLCLDIKNKVQANENGEYRCNSWQKNSLSEIAWAAALVAPPAQRAQLHYIDETKWAASDIARPDYRNYIYCIDEAYVEVLCLHEEFENIQREDVPEGVPEGVPLDTRMREKTKLYLQNELLDKQQTYQMLYDRLLCNWRGYFARLSRKVEPLLREKWENRLVEMERYVASPVDDANELDGIICASDVRHDDTHNVVQQPMKEELRQYEASAADVADVADVAEAAETTLYERALNSLRDSRVKLMQDIRDHVEGLMNCKTQIMYLHEALREHKSAMESMALLEAAENDIACDKPDSAKGDDEHDAYLAEAAVA